jgi:hypothetical protein
MGEGAELEVGCQVRVMGFVPCSVGPMWITPAKAMSTKNRVTRPETGQGVRPLVGYHDHVIN